MICSKNGLVKKDIGTLNAQPPEKKVKKKNIKLEYLCNISYFPVSTPLLQPLCTHHYIDPQNNTITASTDRNTQHI